jgi:hypothetical protein
MHRGAEDDIVAELTTAMRERQLVRFYRPQEDSAIRGYVLDIGPEFFCLALVGDRIWFDGFECFRIVDVEDLEPDPYAQFVEAALDQRKEVRPEPTSVNLDNIGDLILSAARSFALVTLHKELIKPEVCYIGQPISVEGGLVWMLGINPDATWEVEPLAHKLGDITRVNFAGDYEEALALVGGPSPVKLDRSHAPLRLIADNA